ncbi:hypothetical protein Strop_2762 [Salinispora tropica CNB-440]|uniref:Uncharacterized protein n=1 Tax=Salinispora tropica (strain ATCC BAA-916 / DSM 44818 / JCM 13857 / NBRC 105044 / CNB-440) TaxID=369723 RepID=A4X8K4_SALTO|nr:hypothetical protein Strop_2762 [Salinispora tropica CNB-440]
MGCRPDVQTINSAGSLDELTDHDDHGGQVQGEADDLGVAVDAAANLAEAVQTSSCTRSPTARRRGPTGVDAQLFSAKRRGTTTVIAQVRGLASTTEVARGQAFLDHLEVA